MSVFDESSRVVESARSPDGRVRPLYDSFSFAAIPQLIPSLFDQPNEHARRLLGPLARRYDRVILLFIDGFGWRFFERFADRYPFLRRFQEEGTVARITSLFPSTTSVHVTAIHTGQSAGESGVYEWFIYHPALDATIATLPFSFPGADPGSLHGKLTTQDIFPADTLYQRLAASGVRSSIYQHRSIAFSPTSRLLGNGAAKFQFASFNDGLRSLASEALTAGHPAYLFLYHGVIDAVSHEHGPESRPVEQAVERTFNALEKSLHGNLRPARRTLLLLTADHGQTSIDTEIALDEEFPDITRWFRRSARNQPIISGHSRDAVLHVREEHLAEAEEALRQGLAGRADVYRVADLIDRGCYGPTISNRFRERIGNLIILPRGTNQVWLRQYGFKPFKGHHGGLTPDEAHTELLALAYG